MQPHQDTLAALTTPEDQIPAIYLEDWRLVQRCRQGDRGAWAALVERHEAAIFFTIRHALLSRGAEAPEALIADLRPTSSWVWSRTTSGACRATRGAAA